MNESSSFVAERPGARWWKVDFHAHSPASFDFGAAEGKRATAPTSYRDWLLTYMKNGVDVVVVTDHNSHEGIDQAVRELTRLREEQNEDFRELTVIAGVELTVDGGYHLLAVFDADTPSDHVNGLLYRCGYDAERGSSLGTTKMSFAEAVEEIVAMGGLAIPAHADTAAGLFEHDERNQNELAESKHIVAVEVVTAAGQQKALQFGWVVVLGSDAHHLDGSGCPAGIEPKFPGSHYTWVKMESPNLLGIKLALSDGPQSVVPGRLGDPNPNLFTHAVIDKMVVHHAGNVSNYNFGPWMNTVIGGRGVGKSTLIELIRLAMGRFADLPQELQKDNYWFSPERVGRNGGSRFWNDTTTIQVHMRRLNREYKIVWQGSSPERAQITVWNDGEWTPEGGSPRDRFPILVNSQKQIYETSRDPQSLLKAIDDQPSVDFPSWKIRFDSLAGQYRTQRSEIGELAVRISDEDRLRGELSDLAAELEEVSRLRDSPEAKEFDHLTELEQAFNHIDDTASRFERAIEAVLGDFAALDMSDVEETAEQANENDKEVWEPEHFRRTAVSDAYALAKKAVETLSLSRTRWANAASASPRTQRLAELQALLNPDSGDSSSDTVGGDINGVYTRLVESKARLESTLAEIDQAKARSERLREESTETLREIAEHRSLLTQRRSEMASLLSEKGLKLEVMAQADDSQIEADLRSLTSKPSSFETVFSPSGLPSVLEHRFKPGRDQRVVSLKRLLKALREKGADAGELAALKITGIDQRFFSHLKTLDQNRYETDIDLWFPEDFLRVRYQEDGSSGLREIDQGSPGQKTAALLAVILRLSNDPLLLDQPEDDLDNKLISELVVKTLKKIKSNRQVIVVTHNANVVVNADAEHVTVLAHGKTPVVEAQGSIQAKDVKKAICLIMEGGEPALEARYRRLLG